MPEVATGMPTGRADSRRWIVLLALAVAFWPLGVWTADAWKAVTFPLPLDYGEGPLLDQARRLSTLGNLYPPLDVGPPWTVSNYPPVYPAVLAVGAAIFGPGYAWGRLVSVLSAVAVAWWIGRLIHRRTADPLAAGVAGALFLTVPYVAYWSTLQRVDLLALALSWAAISRLVPGPASEAQEPVQPWADWVAAGLLAAAVLTRQTFALAAPGALFVWLVLRGESRRAFRLAALTGGLVLSATALVQILTGGFLDHVMKANWNPWQLSRLPDFAFDALSLLPMLFVGALVYLVWRRQAGSGEGEGDDVRVFVVTYLVLSLVGATTIGKIGSNVNYLLELSAALCLATGACVARLRTSPRLRSLALALLAAQWVTWVPPTRHEMFTQIHFDTADQAAAVLALIEATKGDVLAGQWLGLLPLAEHDIVLQPHERTHLVKHGLWNQAPAVEWLRRGEAELIVLYRPEGLEGLWQGMWTPEMRAAMDEAYVEQDRIGSTRILRPRR